MKRRVNPNLEIYGVVLTMYDGRTNFSAQVAQEVRRHFPGKVFRTAIPRNVRLAEAPSHGLRLELMTEPAAAQWRITLWRKK